MLMLNYYGAGDDEEEDRRTPRQVLLTLTTWRFLAKSL